MQKITELPLFFLAPPDQRRKWMDGLGWHGKRSTVTLVAGGVLQLLPAQPDPPMLRSSLLAFSPPYLRPFFLMPYRTVSTVCVMFSGRFFGGGGSTDHPGSGVDTPRFMRRIGPFLAADHGWIRIMDHGWIMGTNGPDGPSLYCIMLYGQNKIQVRSCQVVSGRVKSSQVRQ